MGLSIKDIIPRREIAISDLKGKVVCVDAFNTLYQFLTTVRQPDGTPLMDSQKNITSHLSGLFYRNVKLLSEGVKLVYVFDGKAPELKAKTHKIRGDVKAEAEENFKTAKQEEDLELMRKYSSQLVRLDDEMIKESKKLLEAMGIPVIQAPAEGEAQAAYLSRTSKNVYCAASQDYDSLLFGATRLVRNLTLARKRKTSYGSYVEISPEMIELEKVLNELQIDRDQLICLGILVGTDYNPKGVPGIGQKKALQIVQQNRYPVQIFNAVQEKIAMLDEEDKFDWKEIFELFKNHEVKDENFAFAKVDESEIKKILVERHDFSEERVQKQLDKLTELEKNNQQKGLGDFF